MKKLMILLALLPVGAFAHTGSATVSGFLHGFSHPFSGLDHLLAMLAIGLWAAQLGGRALWAVPATFIVGMVLGGVLGFSGVALAYVEPGILLTVLLSGVLVASAVKMPWQFSSAMVFVFALLHGFAHGSELPLAGNALNYSLGFSLATSVILTAGLSVAALTQQAGVRLAARLAGGLIAATGVVLAVI